MKEGNVLVQCRFDLTDAEIAAVARKRASIELEMFKVDSAFNIDKERHKKAHDKLDGEASQLAELIRKGYEMRDAECRIEFDHQAGEVRTVREDTGEVVKTRPMTDIEKSKGPLLPFGPTVLLDDSDPDAQAARAAETKADNPAENGAGDATGAAAPPEEPPAETETPADANAAPRPDDITQTGALPAPDPAPPAQEAGDPKESTVSKARAYIPAPDELCLCGHAYKHHRDVAGCDLCDCPQFRSADPLGVAHIDPQAGKEAEV